MPTDRRFRSPERNQVTFSSSTLDEQLADDHRARLVWSFVEQQDLSELYERIQSSERRAGRPATDPRLLLALWLYAVLDGVWSARRLARLCEDSLPYRWLCGSVSVNYHTLSDFRVRSGSFLRSLLERSVAGLMNAGLVPLDCVAQDGMRVRASAGTSSFRTEEGLQRALQAARTHLDELERELEQDPEAGERRIRAARKRAATERQQRLEAASQAARELAARPAKASRKKKQKAPRASTTDPEARTMKMGDGGYRPAYNVQYSTDVHTGIIADVAVTNVGSDQGQLVPSLQRLMGSYGQQPARALVDGGFAKHEAITQAEQDGTAVYAPVRSTRSTTDPHEPRTTDTPEVAAWRQRMATDDAKELFKQRPATAEWANAQARIQGLQQFAVRGITSVLAVATLHALGINLMTMARCGWI